MIKRIFRKYKAMPVTAKATFWFMICIFIQKGSTSITSLLFAHIFTPAEYGIYNVFNAWLGILTVIITLNLSAGVYMQGMTKFTKRRGEYSASLQGLTTTLVIICTVIYLLSMKFWNRVLSLTTAQMLLMMITIWTTCIYAFWTSEQRIYMKYNGLIVLTIVVSLLRPLIEVVFATKSSDPVTARIFAIALVNFCAFSWIFLAKIKKEKHFYSKEYWKYAILFNLPLIPHYLSMVILNSADRIMIESMIGAEAAGIYSFAYLVSMIMMLFTTGLLQTIEPWLYQKIKDRDVRGIKHIAYPLFLGTIVVNFMFMLIAPELITIFAPDSYYEARWIIPPVSTSIFFIFTYTFFAVFEFYFEKRILIMLSTTVGAVLNIVLNYLLIQKFGYFAAGYTTLLCYMIYALCHYICMKKVCRSYLGTDDVFDNKIMFLLLLVSIVSCMTTVLLYNFTLLRWICIGVTIILIVILCNKFKDKMVNFRIKKR